jgi:peptide/nickel transport system substrate-binding protein
VVLEANAEYPAGLGGRPLLDRVVLRIVPEATTRLTELLTGAIHMNYLMQPEEARQLEGQTGATLMHYPGQEFLYLGWNNEREPFRDARVRRALAMAIDRDQLIEALLFGYGEPAAGMIPSWSPVDPAIEPVPFDPAGARALLAEAGWTAGPDGVLQRNGQPLRFTIITSEDRLRQDISVVIQQQLRQVGVAAEVRAMEFQTLLQQHRGRDYDAVISAWTLDTFRVDPSPLFSCAEARNPGSPNRAGYCNPEADRLLEAGLRELDETRAREIWADFSRILREDQPITFLAWQEQLAGVHDSLQGVEVDVRGKFRTASRWWLPG